MVVAIAELTGTPATYFVVFGESDAMVRDTAAARLLQRS
jgi:hypothetical protein